MIVKTNLTFPFYISSAISILNNHLMTKVWNRKMLPWSNWILKFEDCWC